MEEFGTRPKNLGGGVSMVVCCLADYHSCFLIPGYDMYILGDKERTEGSAERAGISNGTIRCMTIRYILVRYF